MQSTKPMGAKNPPRSVAESEQWIKADRERWEWLNGLMAFGLLILLVFGTPLWIWIQFDGVVSFVHMIFGR